MSQNIDLKKILEERPPKQKINFGGIEIEIGSLDDEDVKIGKSAKEVMESLKRASQEDVFPDVEKACVCD